MLYITLSLALMLLCLCSSSSVFQGTTPRLAVYFLFLAPSRYHHHPSLQLDVTSFSSSSLQYVHTDLQAKWIESKRKAVKN